MTDDIRSQTLAQMKGISDRLEGAKNSASRAQNLTDDCAQRVRAALDIIECWAGVPLYRANSKAINIVHYLEFAIENLPIVAQTYGKAMEIAQRAATSMVIQTEGSTNDLPQQSVAAAAMAQLSWANASGNMVMATAKLQDALLVGHNGPLEAAVKEAAAMMHAADQENIEAMAATARVAECVAQYSETI